MVLIAPSLLAADFNNLKEQISLVETAGADWLHLDIMDGHFVPNISYGPDIIKQIRSISNLFFDAHLMVDNPLKIVPMFLNSGVNSITLHVESATQEDLCKVITMLKNNNIKIGISIKPNTNVETIKPYINIIDTILIMTVEPGFGGQKFMSSQLEKIIFIKNMISNRPINIEVDGGITLETGKMCLQNGANVLVAGSSIFKSTNISDTISKFKKLGVLL